MAMQVLDLLEQDYREIYPNEPPLLEGGFEKAMKDIMLPKWEERKTILIKYYGK